MPDASFFARLGLLTERDFLSAEICTTLRNEMLSADGDPATIRSGANAVVNESVRRVKRLSVSQKTKSLVKSCLVELKPRLEEHFKVTLNDFEKPQFLLYTEGSFYTPHQDSSEAPEAPDSFKERKVSVVIFLNSEAEVIKENCYSGGQLTFYGLTGDVRWQKYGFPLMGQEGLLIAFRSDIRHEVTPVTSGTRFTIVTWFY